MRSPAPACATILTPTGTATVNVPCWGAPRRYQRTVRTPGAVHAPEAATSRVPTRAKSASTFDLEKSAATSVQPCGAFSSVPFVMFNGFFETAAFAHGSAGAAAEPVCTGSWRDLHRAASACWAAASSGRGFGPNAGRRWSHTRLISCCMSRRPAWMETTASCSGMTMVYCPDAPSARKALWRQRQNWNP